MKKARAIFLDSHVQRAKGTNDDADGFRYFPIK